MEDYIQYMISSLIGGTILNWNDKTKNELLSLSLSEDWYVIFQSKVF